MGHVLMVLGQIWNLVAVVFVITLFNTADSYANPHYELQNLGTVYSIEQGKHSLYFGGENGLYKITGLNVARYQGPSNSFYGADIEDIYEDQNGDVWIATFGKGMHILRNEVVQPLGEVLGMTTPPYCRNIFKHQNTIFFTCNANVYRYTHDNGVDQLALEGVDIDLSDITSIAAFNGNLVFVDNYSDLYFLIQGDLNKLVHPILKSQPSEINTLFIDGNDLWVGTDDGVLLYNLVTGEFSAVDRLRELGPVSKVFKPNPYEIWIYQSGFKRLVSHKASTNYWENVQDILETDHSTIFDVLVVGNESFVYSAPISGISSFSKFSKVFGGMPGSAPLSDTIQYSLEFDQELFVITENDILLLNDSGEHKSLSPISILINAAVALSDKEFILFTENNGIQIAKRDIDNFSFEKLPFNYDYGSISAAAKLNDQSALFSIIGGDNAGLYKVVNNASIELLIAEVSIDSILRRKNGKFAVATRFSGILPDVFTADKALFGKSNYKYINNCLIEDSSNVLWVCTDGGGLGYFDEATNQTVFIDAQFTANSRHIRDALEDSQGYLWVMTNNGLVRYDHKNSESIQIGKEDGIKDVDFEIDASINLSLHKILIAGDTENYIIDTKLANGYLNERLAQTTNALFIGLSTRERNQRGLLNQSARLANARTENKPLEFDSDEFLFNLTFAAQNFVERQILGYQYRLLGLDDQWTTAQPHENTATFSTLPSGPYQFQLRVFDPKSTAEQPISSIDIIVKPPFWQTWQAYMLYIFVGILLLVFAAKYRTFKLKKLNQMLEKTVADNTIDLATSQNKLARLLNQKEKLFANASHELKTPLTLITGPIENLDAMTLAPDVKNELSVLKRNSQRLMLIVEQILELSNADANTINKRITYDLYQSINVILSSFRPLMQIKNLSLHVDNQIDCQTSLICDSLEKILSNLLLNAYKYTQPDKNIFVNARNTQYAFYLEVRDEGFGIKKEDLDSIFERFTRLDNVAQYSGTGLGLAVVQELIRANDGEITVTSDEGKGTSFKIKIPLRLPTEQQASYVSEPSANFSTDTNDSFQVDINLADEHVELPTILLAEDHEDMSNHLYRILSSSFRCVQTYDGNEAYDKALEYVPDLIITDLMMPNCDGHQLTEKLRSNEITSHVPIIMLTAKGDIETKLSSLKHQVDEFMRKPFSARELKVRVDNLLLIRQKIANKFTTKNQISESYTLELSDSDIFSERDRRFFKKLTAWLEANFSNDELQRQDAASALAISERQLNRKLKALTGYSFNDLLRKYRLNRAAKAIIAGKQISLVAYESGFKTPAYFSTRFKEEFGVSPSSFVEKYIQSKKSAK